MVLTIQQMYIDEMVAHAIQDAPNECCGILAGTRDRAENLYRMTNVEASPYRYSMSGTELLRTTQEIERNGWDLLVIYHSHTHSEAYPSSTDVRMATWPEPDGTSIWPGTYYVLVSLELPDRPVVRAFTIADGVVVEEEIRTA